ncbi:hypothetical protein [Terasakiella sp. SH-1]|uniref:hypothetical protein n=1 Tax=Terasakiella sp. SH-1 TaxID=2560057 RepID=UPI001073182B|nr:hypothetical protein [Terasakiella sp. SH-1]
MRHLSKIKSHPDLEKNSINSVISELALEDLSNLLVVSGPNYLDFRNNGGEYFQLPFSDFYEQCTPPEYGVLCSETPLTNQLAQKLKVDGGSFSDDQTAYAIMHSGLKGAIAPLHFDWDFRWVVNFCLDGKKTFILIPTDIRARLMPCFNLGLLDLQSLSSHQINTLISQSDGQMITIEKGESVIFPSCWWHGVIYEERSVSFSLRFTKSPLLRPLALLPRHPLLQHIATTMWAKNEHPIQIKNFVTKCLETFLLNRRKNDWSKKMIDLSKLYEKEIEHISGENSLKPRLSDHIDGSGNEYAECERLYSAPLKSSEINIKDCFEVETNYIFGTHYGHLNRETKEKAVKTAMFLLEGLQPKRGLIYS